MPSPESRRTEIRPVGPLKPCPFDGGVRLVIVRTERYDLVTHPRWEEDPDVYAFNVHCTSCAAEGPWKKSQSAAEQIWNGLPGTERGNSAVFSRA